MQLDRNKIDLVMAKREMSVIDLAAACGITRQRASMILNSKNTQPKTVGKIANALGVEPEELLEEVKR